MNCCRVRASDHSTFVEESHYKALPNQLARVCARLFMGGFGRRRHVAGKRDICSCRKKYDTVEDRQHNSTCCILSRNKCKAKPQKEWRLGLPLPSTEVDLCSRFVMVSKGLQDGIRLVLALRMSARTNDQCKVASRDPWPRWKLGGVLACKLHSVPVADDTEAAPTFCALANVRKACV